MRTFLLADKLVERGHSLIWWISAFDHFQKKWATGGNQELKINENLTIKTLKGIGYKNNISISRFLDHRIIARKFKNQAPKIKKPDIIIASIPPYDLAYQAVIFAEHNAIPILIDIRDTWPDIFLDKIPNRIRKFAGIALYHDFQMVKKTLHHADGLIAVSQTFLTWGLKYAGRKAKSEDKIFYLGGPNRNKSTPDTFIHPDLTNNLKGKFVVTFIGTFATFHDPSILIDCAKKITNKDIIFVIAGDGDLAKEIQSKAAGLPNVILPGWLNNNQIEALLSDSSVGVCPTPGKADLMPNKAFTYLSAGLPILSAFEGELKEIIENNQIGFYYPYNDVDTLTNCINRLHEDKELYQNMSDKALEIFNKYFDADKIYSEYVEHIEKIAEEFRKKKS